MRPEDDSGCKEDISRVCPEEPGRAGLWYPAPGPVRGFPRGSRSRDLQEQNRSASLRLEDLRRRLLRAFQRAVPRESLRRAREEAEAAAREEQSRERVEGALAGLRAELVSAGAGPVEPALGRACSTGRKSWSVATDLPRGAGVALASPAAAEGA